VRDVKYIEERRQEAGIKGGPAATVIVSALAFGTPTWPPAVTASTRVCRWCQGENVLSFVGARPLPPDPL